MKIAIIGGGIAGLAIASHLISAGYHIDLFYDTPGASMAATGLMHMFVGDTGEKSFMADTAFFESLKLFEDLKGDFYKKTSFIKRLLTDEVRQNLLSYLSSEVSAIDEGHVMIKQAVSVDVPHYLARFKEALEKKGVKFFQRKIGDLNELHGYDQVIVAAGYGIKELIPSLKLKYLKGQSLIFENQYVHDYPLIAKGYLMSLGDKVIIGSTYEKAFDLPYADIYTACRLLEPQIAQYFQPYETLTPIKAISGVRVAHPNSSYPKIIRYDDNVLLVTGLGSRGLLYHGLLGKLIAHFISDQQMIHESFFL